MLVEQHRFYGHNFGWLPGSQSLISFKGLPVGCQALGLRNFSLSFSLASLCPAHILNRHPRCSHKYVVLISYSAGWVLWGANTWKSSCHINTAGNTFILPRAAETFLWVAAIGIVLRHSNSQKQMSAQPHFSLHKRLVGWEKAQQWGPCQGRSGGAWGHHWNGAPP